MNDLHAGRRVVRSGRLSHLAAVFGVVGASFLAVHCGASSDGKGGDGGTGGTGGAGGDSGCPGCDAGDGSPGPYCSDGLINVAGEQCDDGNDAANDGCSATCILEANYVCPTPGSPCVSTVSCGDGRVGGNEQCDDGNALALDGCSDGCQLETGYQCPFPGLRCVAAECGDGIVAGAEECDDGGAATAGCSASCRLEDGWKCDTAGAACQQTTCGDGIREGTEQCDDDNFDLGDGCTPFCKREPDCTAGPCVSACGDGIVLGAEACDDGNQRDGDGCSATCTVETGFSCQQPALPAQMDIPLVVRDFEGVDPLPSVTSATPPDYSAANHVDFELVSGENGATEDETTTRIVRTGQGSSATGRGLDLGQPGETYEIRHLDGTPIATVSLSGKPVYALARGACDKTALPSAGNSWDRCTATTTDGDSFHTWYVDGSSTGAAVTWPNFLGRRATEVKRMTLLLGAFTNANFAAGGTSYTYDSRYMNIDGTIPAIIAGTNPELRTRGFFPVDDLGTTGTTCNDSQGGNEPHNFHFTSEVRFWFEYDSAAAPRLDFSGDDDVWVYVNGHLALDIGGIHGRVAKSFVIDAGNAAAWGLTNGSVYEVAVFQAERNQCASNYWLTLEGFNASRSSCQSTCGDGVIASDELCDDGPNNQSPPGYGQCGTDCKTRGPHCGDGQVQSPEEACDDGVNTSVYDFGGVGCAPGCGKPPSCGDGVIQAPYEQCDDGTNDGGYGGCSKQCTLASRCGNGAVEAGEECDDGPAGSAFCSTQCTTILR